MTFPGFYCLVFARRFVPILFRNCASAFRVLLFPIRVVVTSGVIVIATSSAAYAYIDPGYGSLLWQLLIAGFFGALFYTRGIIIKVKTWLKTMRKDQAKAD